MISKSYWAGLFDGEGCVFVGRKFSKDAKKWYMRIDISLTNTCREPLELLMAKYGGCILKKSKVKNFPVYVWTTSCKKAYNFLKDIKPYSIIKRDKVKIALELQELLFNKHRKFIGYGTGGIFSKNNLEKRELLYSSFKSIGNDYNKN